MTNFDAKVAAVVRVTLLLAVLPHLAIAADQDYVAQLNTPPDGFVAIFNGRDLSGWRGMGHQNPYKLEERTAEQREEKQQADNENMRQHWRVENGELVNDGHGVFLTTNKDYGDFELWIEYKTVPKADSGIYLRGTPQVQIWDTTKEGGKWKLGADRGSGALWNNKIAGNRPLAHADRPFGEWNQLRITMIGEMVTVYMNDQLVVSGAPLENFWDRSRPLPERGPIQLQTHGGEIRWRNVFIREIGTGDAVESGFVRLTDGKSTDGWTSGVKLVDGNLTGRGWYTGQKFGNFVLRFDVRTAPGANSGIGIRSAENTNPAYAGMELQVLDNEHPKYAQLKPWQYHGSIYGIVAAKRGHQRPAGRWNSEEIVADGDRITVRLNGATIVEADIREVTKHGTASGREHPGLFNRDGYLSILGHGGEVAFRNMRIKVLETQDPGEG